MAVFELEVRDDELLVARVQLCQRRAVAPLRLVLHRELQRRRRVRRQAFDGVGAADPARRAAVLVGDAVAHGGAKVVRERAAPLRLKRVEARQRPEHGVLDQIARVGGGARPLRQAAVRPALQIGQRPREQASDRARIAGARAAQQRA